MCFFVCIFVGISDNSKVFNRFFLNFLNGPDEINK